jgi:hypothetical protein
MWKKNKRKDTTSAPRKDPLLKRFPNLDKLLSEEPGLSPWYQRDNKQVFTTPKGPLTWSRPNDELLLLNSAGDVVGVVRNGTKVKQIDGNRLLVSFETRFLDRRREDPANRNALDMSIVRIDDLPIIKDFKTESLSMKKQARQFIIGSPPDAHCAVPLKVSEGMHSFPFPDHFKFIDEILHLSDYLPRDRLPGQHEDVALFILRPKKDEFDVFPQDWYNLEGWDTMYQGPDKAVRDPTSGRIFVRNIRIRDIVLDDSNRKGEWR